jgi:hypothetical protein
MKIFNYLIIIILISFLVSFNAVRVFPVNEMSLFLTVVGLIYGLIAAFTINNTWERFSKIRDAISEETSSLLNLYVILRRISDKSLLGRFSRTVKEYCSEVVQIEWKDYWSSEQTHKKFMELFDIIGEAKLKTTKDEVLYEQCYQELREASTARTQQLVLAQTKLSVVHWVLVLFLSAVLVVSIVFMSLPLGFMTIFISTCMMASVGLILLVIYELDSMKTAEKEVSVDPYTNLAKKLSG